MAELAYGLAASMLGSILYYPTNRLMKKLVTKKYQIDDRAWEASTLISTLETFGWALNIFSHVTDINKERSLVVSEHRAMYHLTFDLVKDGAVTQQMFPISVIEMSKANLMINALIAGLFAPICGAVAHLTTYAVIRYFYPTTKTY